ncbi:MAG: hypothetical protein MJ245_05810 [Clostridia bacterium]|nr:hypothetical protein [Clostridia bacterium]
MKGRKNLLMVALISVCAILAIVSGVNYYLVKNYGYRVDYGMYRSSFINGQTRYMPGEDVILYSNYQTETPEDTQVAYKVDGAHCLTMWDAQKECYVIKFEMPANSVKISFNVVDHWTP